MVGNFRNPLRCASKRKDGKEKVYIQTLLRTGDFLHFIHRNPCTLLFLSTQA
jgi:hypothetical protein